MRKEILFVFIALLPISIQAQNHEFSLGSLLELHNDERNIRGLNKLIIDPEKSTLAQALAEKSITDTSYNIINDVKINQTYKVNIFRLKYTHFYDSGKLSSTSVFSQWFVQEVYTNENKEVMEYPSKIICKNTKQIGLGYVDTEHEGVVIALYYPNTDNC